MTSFSFTGPTTAILTFSGSSSSRARAKCSTAIARSAQGCMRDAISLLDQMLGGRVEARRGFVKDDQPGILQKDAGKSQQLGLSC